MAYEFLEKLFGTPKEGEQPKAMTFAELTAAIEADKHLKLVDLSAGGYVAQNLYDAQKTELDGVKQQLSDANTTIKGYKDMKPDELKQAVTDWETKYNTDTQALKDQLTALSRTHAEDKLLSGYKFTSKAARNGVAAELKAQGFKLNESGELVGGADWLKGLTTQEDYKGAFVTETSGDAGNTGNQNSGPRFSGPTGVSGSSGHSNTNPFGNMGFTYVNPPKK